MLDLYYLERRLNIHQNRTPQLLYLENLIEDLDEENRSKFIEHLVMAGEERAVPDPAKELRVDSERSDWQKFEPIGMIMRRMIDKAYKATKGGILSRSSTKEIR